MMDVKCNGRQITINGKLIELDHKIFQSVVLDDRVIVEFNNGDYAVGDHEVGRNVACFGPDGRMLWQIEPSGVMVRSSYGGMIPESFCNLYQDADTGQISIGIWSGWIYKLDPETGEYFDGVFKK